MVCRLIDVIMDSLPLRNRLVVADGCNSAKLWGHEACEFRGGRASRAGRSALLPYSHGISRMRNLQSFFRRRRSRLISTTPCRPACSLTGAPLVRDEGETAVARFDRAVGGDHKRQILD